MFKSIESFLLSVQKNPQSLVEIIEHYNGLIAQSKLNAFITTTPELAIENAKKISQNIGKYLLAGLPLAVKDAFCTNGVRTTMASKMLHNFIPQYESTVTSRLFENGAIMLGKANMDEFAMGSSGKHSAYGATISPIKIDEHDLIPGGSSSGSAAAVAGGLALAAIGTDTGGSVRQPASFCGVVGFKPSYGRVSRFGIVAYASSLDQAGFLTKTVKDSALLFSMTYGADGKDSTLVNLPPENFLNISGDVRGKVVGIPEEFMFDSIHPDIKSAWENAKIELEKAGAKIKTVNLKNALHSIKVYYFVSTAEASSNLARFDGVKYGYSTQKDVSSIEELVSHSRAEGFGKEVRSRILVGTKNLLSDSYKENYERILKLRRLIKDEFTQVFSECDVILCPTTPNLAPRMNEKQTQLEEYINDILTVPVNIAGLPAISVPFGKAKCSRPIGMQLIAKEFCETTLFDFAQALENAQGLV